MDDMDNGDLRYFSQYPMPPRLAEEDRQKLKLTSSLRDEYLESLEAFIDELGEFIRGVQKQEVSRQKKEESKKKKRKENARPAQMMHCSLLGERRSDCAGCGASPQ